MIIGQKRLEERQHEERRPQDREGVGPDLDRGEDEPRVERDEGRCERGGHGRRDPTRQSRDDEQREQPAEHRQQSRERRCRIDRPPLAEEDEIERRLLLNGDRALSDLAEREGGRRERVAFVPPQVERDREWRSDREIQHRHETRRGRLPAARLNGPRSRSIRVR
jgi:hypothetical protein